jgi:ribosome-associated translation inhibitor RaiA
LSIVLVADKLGRDLKKHQGKGKARDDPEGVGSAGSSTDWLFMWVRE